MLPDHAYHALAVVDVIDETADTRSFVLEIPPALEETFAYAAGQFCTFRATIGGEPVVRCYSMSSSPDTGDPFTTTVKRVPGGPMSNWMNDTLARGRHDRGDAPGGALRAARDRRPDRRVRGRQRHHAGDLDHQDRARHHGARDHAGVRQPRGRFDHLRRRARAPARGIRRPALGPSSPRFRARLPRCRGVRGAGARPRARRLLHLRSGPLHGHGRGRPLDCWASPRSQRFIERFEVPDERARRRARRRPPSRS